MVGSKLVAKIYARCYLKRSFRLVYSPRNETATVTLRELDGRETIGSSAPRPLFSPSTHGDVALEAERVARTPLSPRAAAFRACDLKTRAKTRRRSPQNSATNEPTAYSRHLRARRDGVVAMAARG